jgi:predicted dehydrogenase
MSAAVLIGVLGCGRAAERLHIPAILRMRDARLTAVCDPVPERRQLLARIAPGCRAFASAEELLAARVVDAVIVASPPETHARLAELALQAGLPVLVEKPLAASLNEALGLAELERKVRQPVMVGFNRRWWEPAQVLHRALSRCGDAPVKLETLIVSDLAAWGAAESPADPLDDLAVHHLHLLPYLLDRVIATVRAHRPGPRDIELTLRFHGGSEARCLAGFGPSSDERVAVEAGGRHFSIRTGSGRIRPAGGAFRTALDVADAVQRRVLGGRGSLTRSYERQLRAFLDWVQAGRGALAVSPGTVDGIAVMLAVQAARESLARDGAEISVPYAPTS